MDNKWLKAVQVQKKQNKKKPGTTQQVEVTLKYFSSK